MRFTSFDFDFDVEIEFHVTPMPRSFPTAAVAGHQPPTARSHCFGELSFMRTSSVDPPLLTDIR
jgi:hypothetical protein